ncbi:LOB domain-containing protein 38-like [Forsythia ovata]|uniref:LOB domain-containing protein 38-like n=1 Tax=Forsythia ovata TaxID=205694 RepID=A0ABD1UYN1_9LAMI
MSCNGCRVLRRGCSEQCILRPCLDWIESPDAQGNATLFISKFFGRRDLMTFISAAPENKRPALFQSLLFEACGRTVNPVNGAVGLLSTGNWHICQAAVEKVLGGSTLQPIATEIMPPNPAEISEAFRTGGSWSNTKNHHKAVMYGTIIRKSQPSDLKFAAGSNYLMMEEKTTSFDSGISEVSPGFGRKEPKLLNLFV